jgi:TolB-like protein/DNA-binding winged helix-turn-helix (wHTH) protein/Tfp pilus assembly protein PilF
MSTGIRCIRVYNPPVILGEIKMVVTPPSPDKRTLGFGVFELDLETGELHKSGHKVSLRPQAVKVLIMLATRAGQMVTREVLEDQIWGHDTFVDFEHGLNLCIQQIRAALDDDANTPRYIETLPRRGYRFIAPVHDTNGHAPAFAPGSHNGPAAHVQAEELRSDVRAPQQIAQTPKRRWPLWLAACLALLVLVPGIYQFRAHSRPHARPPAGRIMFVVLPFENLSGDPEQEYFSDGLTEEMISRLGQFAPERLGIIARTSAIQYKGTKKQIDQIGKELGVDYVLEGTVRRAGDRVRISAQLIQVSDQTHLWARNYERDLSNVLSVQQEVAQSIANEVEIKLTPERQALQVSATPVNPAALEAYLKGRYYLTKTTGRDFQRALEYFQQSTELDANFALAYASLGETYNALNTGYLAPVEAGPRAKAAAMKALELDESLPLAHSVLARVRLIYDWNWPGAEQEFLRSLELNSNLPDAHLGYAEYLATVGRFQESIEHIHTAFALDPLSANARFQAIGTSLYVSRRYEETLEECRKARELPPDFTEPFETAAFVYVRLGRFQEAAQAAKAARIDNPPDVAQVAQVYAESGNKEEARKLLQQLLVAAQKGFVCGYNVATVYASLGETDKAFYWLREGIKQRSR